MTFEILIGIIIAAVIAVLIFARFANRRALIEARPQIIPGKAIVSVVISIPLFIYVNAIALVAFLQLLQWIGSVSFLKSIVNFVLNLIADQSSATWLGIITLLAISAGVGWICHVIIGAICKDIERTAYLARLIAGGAVLLYFLIAIIVAICNNQSFLSLAATAVISAVYTYNSYQEYARFEVVNCNEHT